MLGGGGHASRAAFRYPTNSYPYGNTLAPVSIGSGGGDSCSDSGGSGGSALHLIATLLELNGTISANG